jgi:hypothetical protein
MARNEVCTQTGWRAEGGEKFFISNLFLEHYRVDKDEKPSNPTQNTLTNSREPSHS